MIRYAALGLILAAAPAAAQVSGPRTPAGCLDVSDARSATPITVKGRLTMRVFAGAPNFTSTEHGDAAEHAYVLTLPSAICIDDGGNFSDPAKRFRKVQVWAKDGDPIIERLLEALVGHRATIIGTGMPARTGHHHRPLLIEARSVSDR